jgi:hypothetical protein
MLAHPSLQINRSLHVSQRHKAETHKAATNTLALPLRVEGGAKILRRQRRNRQEDISERRYSLD